MHPQLLGTLADQRRARLLAGADAHNLVATARRVPGAPRGESRGTWDMVWVDGAALHVRPVALDDVDRLERLFSRLSPRSVRLRFFSPIRRLSRPQLVRLAHVDHARREAIVAVHDDEIVAVARYDARDEPREAEVALTVEDAWQHRGVGSWLARRLTQIAVARGFETFVASILPENRAALGLVRALAPHASIRWNHGEYEASIPLAPAR